MPVDNVNISLILRSTESHSSFLLFFFYSQFIELPNNSILLLLLLRSILCNWPILPDITLD